MKKQTFVFRVLIIFAIGLLLTLSCDLFGDTPKPLLSPVHGEIDPAVRTAMIGANDFAFRLSAELLKNNNGANFVFSPFSLWLPLAALGNALDNQYQGAHLRALNAPGITQNDLNRAASRMLHDLTGRNHNPLRIANAIFVDRSVTLQRDFARTFMDFYRGSSQNVNFSSRNAVNTVNRWASQNTDGLINNLIQEFPPDTLMAIANAIYFSDRWSWQFSRQQTEEGVFHSTGGEGRAFFMRREGRDQTYFEDSRLQAIDLRFEHAGGMLILLPKTGTAEALLSSMTNDYFVHIQRSSFLAEGKLLLPRFSIENNHDLLQSMAALGFPLFEGELTGLIEEAPISVSSAIQRALIMVDEEGATAAAVTVIGGNGSPPPPPPQPRFEMICNRPFVFILYAHTVEAGSQVLFTGIVNQP